MLSSMKKPLFIFEMANNHQGSVENGLEIIQQVASICKDYDYLFAFKFQYRDLDTFIHPDYIQRTDIKNVKRFLKTRISSTEFLRLKTAVKDHGLISICTPFDEASVDLIMGHQYDIIKIGSCSLGDWPLMEKIATTGKPVIASTAGSALEEIDKLVNFFINRKIDLALMHCVAEYPTTLEDLQLNQIDLMTMRYPRVIIGYSTHESPDNYDAIKIAIAKKARIFEKHVGIHNESYPLNSYSATPQQIRYWLNAARAAILMCGIDNERYQPTSKERSDLNALRRGLFAYRPLARSQILSADDYYLAFPAIDGQLVANDLSKYHEIHINSDDLNAGNPIMREQVEIKDKRPKIENALKKVLTLVQKADIVIPLDSASDISHHYGIENFEKYGATIINCLNREYCKKYIVVLPGQNHPAHFHKSKEETFVLVYGEMTVVIDGRDIVLRPGESLTIERGSRHSFSSATGAVVEEISTTHYANDSFYEDEVINRSSNRKTAVYLTSEFFKYRRAGA